MSPTKLSDIEIQRALGTLDGWTRKGETITKTFEFPTFPDGIRWVDRIAVVAERMQHHPDLDIRYTRIVVSLSTHDAGGVTALDLDLAREMEVNYKSE
jgi:4a-hydroxytetrahydrobiopterin dehydratase